MAARLEAATALGEVRSSTVVISPVTFVGIFAIAVFGFLSMTFLHLTCRRSVPFDEPLLHVPSEREPQSGRINHDVCCLTLVPQK